MENVHVAGPHPLEPEERPRAASSTEYDFEDDLQLFEYDDDRLPPELRRTLRLVEVTFVGRHAGTSHLLLMSHFGNEWRVVKPVLEVQGCLASTGPRGLGR